MFVTPLFCAICANLNWSDVKFVATWNINKRIPVSDFEQKARMKHDFGVKLRIPILERFCFLSREKVSRETY